MILRVLRASDPSDADFRLRQMAWHMGHPLSQSLFSSFYIDRLIWPEPMTPEEARFDREGESGNENPMVHVVLRAFCVALIKACGFVYHTICGQQFYEASFCQPVPLQFMNGTVLTPVQEEDFVSNLYHRGLLPNFKPKDVYSLLDQAIDHIRQQDDLKTTGLQDALMSRLIFRKSFLFSLEQASDCNVSNTWKHCLRELLVLRKTRPLGLPVNSAFSAKIQRRLASTVPPRPIVEISFEQAYDQLQRTCQFIGEANRLKEYHGGSNLMVCPPVSYS